MWSFIDSKTNQPLQPRLLEVNGRRVSQAELCEEVCRLLETGSPVVFISAPGSGKTLIAICAMMCVAQRVEEGSPILFLTPTKPLEETIVRILTEYKYPVNGDYLRVFQIYGRQEFPCPFWSAKGQPGKKATHCVKTSCELYIPPTRDSIGGLRQVASWGQWKLYGLEELSEEMARARGAVTEYGGAYLCPYFAQYRIFDASNGPRVIVMNYAKFEIDYRLGRVNPGSVAGVIIDEADLWLERYGGVHVITIDDMKYLKDYVKAHREEIGKSAERFIGIINDLLEMVRSQAREPRSRLMLPLEVMHSLVKLREMVFEIEDERVAADIAEVLNIPMVGDVDDMVGEYDTSTNTIFIRLQRLPMLGELSTVPSILMTGTPDYIVEDLLGVKNKLKSREVWGSVKAPGKVYLVFLSTATVLRGRVVRKNEADKALFKEICREGMKEVYENLRVLRSTDQMAKGIFQSVARVYIDVCKDYMPPNTYVDDPRSSIADLEAAMYNQSIEFIMTTRTGRGIGSPGKVLFTVSPKFPRPDKNSPMVTYIESYIRSRGPLYDWMLERLFGKGIIMSGKDFMDAIAYKELYQTVLRGNRGEDYVNYVAAMDIEVYSALARMHKAGLLTIAGAWWGGEVLPLDESEIDVLAFLSLSNRAQAEKLYKGLRDKVMGRSTRAGKKEAVQAVVAVPQQQQQPKATAEAIRELPKPPEPQQTQQVQMQPQVTQQQAAQPPIEVKTEVKTQSKSEEFGPLRPMREVKTVARASEGQVEWTSVLLAQRDVDVTVPVEIVFRGVQDIPGLFTPEESRRWALKMYRAWKSGKNVREVLANAYEEALKRKATKEKT